MKVLFDSDKIWDTVDAGIEKAWHDDPEMVCNEWYETFLDDMRSIKIERMEIETTPPTAEFPKDWLYYGKSIGDLLAKIDWARLKVFVDDKNELQVEYVKDRVEYKARIYELDYIERRLAFAQIPLGAYVEDEYDKLRAKRSVDRDAASKMALASLRQYPTDAKLLVCKIDARDFRDGNFDAASASTCYEYDDVAELSEAYRDFDGLGAIDGLQVVAAEYLTLEEQGDCVVLYGISED